MARNFKKTPKSSGTRQPTVKNKNRDGMVLVEKDGEGVKKIPFQIKYTSPAPYVSDLSHVCIDRYHIRAILLCDVRLDGLESRKSIVLCPFRREVLKTLLFKFGVENFI